MSRQRNPYLASLNTRNPLRDELFHDLAHDIKVYSAQPLGETNEDTPHAYPFDTHEVRNIYFGKCTAWVARLAYPFLEEYLFYDIVQEQGMIMAYRPDRFRPDRWCLSVNAVLPPKRPIDYSRDSICTLKRLLRRSEMPSLALQYVIELSDVVDKIDTYWNEVKIGDWVGAGISGKNDFGYNIDKKGIESVGHEKALKRLKLIEV